MDGLWSVKIILFLQSLRPKLMSVNWWLTGRGVKDQKRQVLKIIECNFQDNERDEEADEEERLG